MAGHVFLTYSATDATDPYMQAVVSRLTAAGLSVHAQQETTSAAVTPATRKLVDACGALVPVIMPATEMSERVRLEVEYAHAHGKPVMALWVGGSVPSWLAYAEIDNVNGRRPPSSEFVKRLIDVALAASREGVPMPPLKRPGRTAGAKKKLGPPVRPTAASPEPTSDDPAPAVHAEPRAPALRPPPLPSPGTVPVPAARAPERASPSPQRRIMLVLAVIGGLLVLLAGSAAIVYEIAR